MQNKIAELENFIKEHDRIFVDSSAFLIDQNNSVALKAFWQHITPLLKQHRKKIILPFCIANEITKQTNANDKITQNLAREAIKLIGILREGQSIDIFGNKNDSIDNIFNTIFTKFRNYYTMLLITRDDRLAKDILALNNKNTAKRFGACIISDDGFLEAPKINKIQNIINTIKNVIISKDNTKQETLQPFQIGVKPTTISNEVILSNRIIPKSNDFVFTSNKEKIQLKDEIGQGGEGAVYETNTQYIAKIYYKYKVTKRIYEKLQLMISRKVAFEGICFPVDILLNAHNEFVGYLMPKAKGYQLQKIMFSKPLLNKYFPNFTKRDMIELCITILKKIEFLHSINVILGDINPNNILVVSPKEVYFVDTDSYQVEGFPCPVGTINFTAPEIQGKKYDSFLRTMGNEKFAIATLLFMIMLPGKPPYSQKDGENLSGNIKNGNFPYSFKGKANNQNAPEGSWKYMWSHLDYKVREGFYCTFAKDEKYNDKNNRLSAKKWLEIFENYHKQLDSMLQIDEMSNKIFPSRYKKVRGAEYINCRLCGEEVDKQRNQIKGICKSCLYDDLKAEILKCSCGETIFYRNFDKYIIKKPKPRFCEKCLKNK